MLEQSSSKLQCSVVSRVIARGSSSEEIGVTGCEACGLSSDIGLSLNCSVVGEPDSPPLCPASPRRNR